MELRCAGAFSGTITVDDPSTMTVQDLKASLALKMGLPNSCAPGLKVIAGGRTLKEDAQHLDAYGVRATTRLMVMHSQAAGGQLAAQEERMRRLDRLKDAALAMSSRGGDRYSRGNRLEFELENQDGLAMTFDSEADRRSLIMALALHNKGIKTMHQGDPRAALQELLLAEEAFGLCSPQHLAKIDNLALLLIDIVWCMFQLQDVASLGAAAQRLALARQGLARSYGHDLGRLRVLHGNFQPELATFLRLELLEGVAAFHSGRRDESRAHLLAAQDKYRRLLVDDASLATLLSMGFSSQESTRALRFCGGDTQAAGAFAVEARAKQRERMQQDRQRRKDRKKQRRFGQTPSGKYVDLALLNQLTGGLGYEEELAAEALRAADNSADAALDTLTNPDTNAALQAKLEEKRGAGGSGGGGRKGKRKYQVDEAQVLGLCGMGFARTPVLAALEQHAGDTNAALDALQDMGDEAKQWYHDATAAAPGPSTSAAAAAGGSGSGGGAAAGGGGSGSNAAAGEEGEEEEPAPEPGSSEEEEGRDEEMEREVADATQSDPLAAYDVDVGQEGRAVAEYLALLESAAAAQQQPT